MIHIFAMSSLEIQNFTQYRRSLEADLKSARCVWQREMLGLDQYKILKIRRMWLVRPFINFIHIIISFGPIIWLMNVL